MLRAVILGARSTPCEAQLWHVNRRKRLREESILCDVRWPSGRWTE
jgi:hypothetical protein